MASPSYPANASIGEVSFRKPDVFISYASEDRRLAELLSSKLDESGIVVWRDISELRFGDTFAGKIAQAIEDCPLFIVLVTAASLSSWWVEAETAFATERHKRVLPVVAENVTLAGGLELYLIRLHRYEVLDRPIEQHLPNIIVEVRRYLAEARAGIGESSSPVEKAQPRSGLARYLTRYGLAVAASMAMLLLAGLFSWRQSPRVDESPGPDASPTDATHEETSFAVAPPPGMIRIPVEGLCSAGTTAQTSNVRRTRWTLPRSGWMRRKSLAKNTSPSCRTTVGRDPPWRSVILEGRAWIILPPTLAGRALKGTALPSGNVCQQKSSGNMRRAVAEGIGSTPGRAPGATV